MPVIVGAGFCPSGFWPDWAARFADQAAPPLPKYMSPLIWSPFTVPFIVMSIAPFCVCIENEMTIAFSLSEISTGTSPCGPEIDPASGRTLVKWVVRRTNHAQQLDRLLYLYDASDPDGAVQRSATELELRYFTCFELELLLERAGFFVEALFGDYDLTPYGAESQRLIAVAHVQKASA